MKIKLLPPELLNIFHLLVRLISRIVEEINILKLFLNINSQLEKGFTYSMIKYSKTHKNYSIFNFYFKYLLN